MGTYDVIVVGAGHAGCEAALAASRMGCRTLILTLNLGTIAQLDCNPSVGGPAKGHLVREIDALGGQMARAADRALLQIRTLNTSKGPAVQTLRAQVDRLAYQSYMRNVLELEPGLFIKQAVVHSLVFGEGKRVIGVRTTNGSEYRGDAIVLSTGVYMDARVITGKTAVMSGPNGQLTTAGLAHSLRDAGLKLGRFKTGTPPRIDRRTVDFTKMRVQPGDAEPSGFSFNGGPMSIDQMSCYLTYTNERTHAIVRQNIDRAPMFNGSIEGIGPRHCPSLEDKVMRFPEKTRHQVFIEPEGRDRREMYVMGMSTSLPEDVQIEMLRTVPGLERAELMRTGYAIEYDYVEPTQLRPTLEYKHIPGLFGAGQINGSSGYEEAAAQGLLAGINAALGIKNKRPLVLDRSEAYIGVLVDDLVTKGTLEPYRMFTSRAEYRLRLRHNNADFRLTETGHRLGLVDDARFARFESKKARLESAMKALEKQGYERHLRRPEVSYQGLRQMFSDLPELDADLAREIETVVKFEGYLKRQDAEVARFKKLEGHALPAVMDYTKMAGLSRVAREELERLRPESVGAASRIPGVSPADVSVLLVHLQRLNRPKERGPSVGDL